MATARQAASRGKPSPVEPRALQIKGDRIRLRGRPAELVGIVDVARAPMPGAPFELATMDVQRTEFGYRQQLAFAPLRSSKLPLTPEGASGLSFLRTPAPSGSGRVPVRFTVHPSTPPGRYEAVFDVAGEPQRADIEVLADPRLAIEPGRIAIAGPPGGVCVEALVLINQGNVPLEIDLLGMLVLQEEEQVCLSLQRALARVKSEDKEAGAHQLFFDALARSLAERKTEFGRVRVAGGPVVLDAGAAEHVDVEFHLPSDMIPKRHYRAMLKARTARLFVTITAEVGGERPVRRSRRPAGS